MSKLRKILFRGKAKPTYKCPTGTWVHGSLIVDDETNEYFIDYAFRAGSGNNGIWKGGKVVPETVGQFTGLHDKTGKKIFEGDIVRYPTNDIETLKAEVIYKFGGFCTHVVEKDRPKPHPLFIIDEEKIEIIGNIHDNPELLKTDQP